MYLDVFSLIPTKRRHLRRNSEDERVELSTSVLGPKRNWVLALSETFGKTIRVVLVPEGFLIGPNRSVALRSTGISIADIRHPDKQRAMAAATQYPAIPKHSGPIRRTGNLADMCRYSINLNRIPMFQASCDSVGSLGLR